MEKIIVCFDVHGTLVYGYRPRIGERILWLMKKLRQTHGVEFALVSDSSLTTQHSVYAQQIQGRGRVPLLGLCYENGAGALMAECCQVHFLEKEVREMLAAQYTQARADIWAWCATQGITCWDGIPDVQLCVGARVRAPDGLLVMVDNMRRSSCFFDARVVRGGTVRKNAKRTQPVVDALLGVVNGCFGGVLPQRVYRYPEFGGHHQVDVGKAPFMRYLLEQRPDARIYMVGDGLNDIPAMQVPGVTGVCVSTCEDVVRAARITTSTQGPAGTAEFLRFLLEQLE